MIIETIDHKNVIELFHSLMEKNASFHILQLCGEAKLGKSHFVTKIFPHLARDKYGAKCAVIDFRNPAQDITDILHSISELLGGQPFFSSYSAAYQEWLNRPHITVDRLKAILALVQIKGHAEQDENRRMIRHLVSQFLVDMNRLSDIPMLFVFDTLDEAPEATRTWIIHNLIAHLVSLNNVRVVLAARTMPPPPGTYVLQCQTYEMLPVREDAAYIEYCRQIGASLPDQSIRDLARVFDYKPGLFVDLVVPRFIRHE